MSDREMIIELIGQTLAPRLFQLYGTKPEDMGFPICDTKEEFDTRVARQFNPVGYWIDEGRLIAKSIVSILEAGGMDFSTLEMDAMCAAAAKERPDVGDDGAQKTLDDLVP